MTVTVPVDETLNVEKMVENAKLTFSNSQITSVHFPKVSGGKSTVKKIALFSFNKSVSSEVAISEMKKRGYVPITIQDLLSLAVKYPNLQREHLIVAFGSVCALEGVSHVAFIYGFSLSRQLRLYNIKNDWSDICRFAAIRK